MISRTIHARDHHPSSRLPSSALHGMAELVARAGTGRDPRGGVQGDGGEMSNKSKLYVIPDAEVLRAVDNWSQSMTYVVRNILSKGRPYLGTPQILRQLKRLEKEGKVKRIPSSYMRQHCWAVVR